MKDIDSVGIVRFPPSEAGALQLSNIVKICSEFSNEIYIISGNKAGDYLPDNSNMETFSVNHKSGNNAFTRILRFLITQLIMTFGIIQKKDTKNYLIFSPDLLLIPILTGKILGKNIVIAEGGAPAGSDLESKRLKTYLELTRSLSDGILIASENLIKEWGLEKFQYKIMIASEHIIDLEKFNIKKQLHERKYDIGYIGRFGKRKNVMGFLKAIPLIQEEKQSLKGFLGGDGIYKEKVLRYIKKKDIEDSINYEGWIDHEKLPDYLNNIKLLVIPSHSEGLPNIMLEAMACGTPVLISSVGAVPDLIEDEKNGFILEDNSPEVIAKNVLKIIEYDEDEMGKITKNANRWIYNNYKFKNVVKRYNHSLRDIFN